MKKEKYVISLLVFIVSLVLCVGTVANAFAEERPCPEKEEIEKLVYDFFSQKRP